MTTRTKPFDCVEMKRKAQEKLMAEYQNRKAEFRSYGDFLRSKASQSKLATAIRAKLAGRPARTR